MGRQHFSRKSAEFFKADIAKEFQNVGSVLLVVSFGERDGALRWLDDTGCSLDMVLDPLRQVYHAFGLRRSVLKVWSISSLVYYAEQMCAGKKLPSPYENIHDDPNQMGGDFIVGKDGKLLLTYCSQSSSDRPSADLLLETIRTYLVKATVTS